MPFTRYSITIEGETTQIGTANELAVALDVLQGQYDREALIQLQPYIAKIIVHASGMMTVMKSLSVEDQLFLISSIGIHMAGVIQNAGRLRDILATLADQKVEEALLNTLGQAGLQSLIMTGKELAEVLEWVYDDCDTLVLDLLGDEYIRRLCRHASDLSAILHNINFDLQARLLDRLGWIFVVSLIKDGYDLAYLLRALPPDHSANLIHHFSKAQLKELIGNSTEWAYLYQRLEPAESDYLMKMLSQ